METSTVLAWIAIFGVVTGFRSMLPMAVLSYYAWHLEIPMPHGWDTIGNLWVMLLLFVLAAGELAADKWKGMPNRTRPLGLFGRLSMGALGGAILAASTLVPWWKGALDAALMAIVGAAVGFSLRQYFKEATRADDSYIAVGEDLLTFVGAMWVLNHLA